ncbi:membrane protein insertase YidC [Nitrospira sp. Kam-Ns4a]
MEKRVILFLVLSLAIILGYDYLLRQLGLAPTPGAGNPPDGRPAEERPTGARPEAAPTQQTLGPAKPGPAPASPSKPVPGAVTPSSGTPEQTVVVETDLYRAVLTNRGGVITSWELKRYRLTAAEDSPPVQLVYRQGKFKGPLSVLAAEPAITRELAEGLYEVERDFTTLDTSHPVGHLTFRYRAAAGNLALEKQLTFRYNSYLVDVAVRASGLQGGVTLGLGTNFGIVEWGEGFIGLIGPASLVDGLIEKDTPETEAERKGAVGWVAMQDKYFISVLIPTNGAAALARKEGDKLVSASVRFAPDAAATVTARLYAGPKEYDTLKALGLGLEETIDFGWFIYGSWSLVKAVAWPLFAVLRFVYGFTHNYGVAIILLTVAIKLLFVPLQYKSYKSMKDMQVIQPKVLALQAKYKDDRERLNRELIKLYRDHKVNPVGGCLPMLLQMPVFVALFNILYMTIDLRQAPFVLWITDLSVQDPYYVLPVLMGISMVVQQKIMPTTMDPTQAKIMLVFPAFLTLLFLTFPAGLVLYWLTNNVLTIAQQFVTDRYIFKKPALASELLEEAGSPDGQKAAGKGKKDKVVRKAETDSQVEA